MKKYSYAISFLFEVDSDLDEDELYNDKNIKIIFDSLKKSAKDCIQSKDSQFFYTLDVLYGEELEDYNEAKEELDE